MTFQAFWDIVGNGGSTGTLLLLLFAGWWASKQAPKAWEAIMKLALQMEKQNDLCEKMINYMKEKEKNGTPNP